MKQEQSIGEKIRIQRQIKNYTQEYMSWALEISQAAYSKIERDETELSISRIYAIAEILEISPFTLLPPPKYSIGIHPAIVYKVIRYSQDLFRAAVKRLREYTRDTFLIVTNAITRTVKL